MLIAALCSLLLVVPAPPGASGGSVDTLPAEVVAQREPPADEIDVDGMLRAEREAELELALGAIRLGSLKARARLAQGRYGEALELATAARTAVDGLPATVERAPLTEPLDRVLREARAAHKAAQRPVAPAEAAPPASTGTPVVPGAVERHERAEREGPIPDRDYFLDRKQFPFTDPARLDADCDAYLAKILRRMGEDEHITSRIVVYPKDWCELTQRRARFRDGTIYKGPKFKGPNGEVLQTIIYDVQSLLLGPPHFAHAPQLDQIILTPPGLGWAVGPYSCGSGVYTAYGYGYVTGIPMLPFFGPGARPVSAPPEPESEQPLAELLSLVQQVLESN